MKKQEIIKKLKRINPLRSTASWNKCSIKELNELYNEAIEIEAIRK